MELGLQYSVVQIHIPLLEVSDRGGVLDVDLMLSLIGPRVQPTHSSQCARCTGVQYGHIVQVVQHWYYREESKYCHEVYRYLMLMRDFRMSWHIYITVMCHNTVVCRITVRWHNELCMVAVMSWARKCHGLLCTVVHCCCVV